MALIPPSFFDCVTAIGVVDPDDGSKSWVGTGFLVGRLYEKIDDNKKRYIVFLVTNKHVLQDEKSNMLNTYYSVLLKI